MKKLIPLFLLLASCGSAAIAQTYNAAYVKALFAKYPTVKSNQCPACRLWKNPYYTSIADTVKAYPVCEHAVVTATDVVQQEANKVPRTGIYASWTVPPG